MGKRESLRDLHTRLAERLSLLRSSDAGQAWLAVTAGTGNYLLSLRQSGEVLPAARAYTVPRTASWFIGVLNVRGSLFGAVNLGQFIEQSLHPRAESRPQSQQDGYDVEHGRFVTLNPLLDVNCALHVSDLVGLRATENFESSVPRLPHAPAFFGPQFFDQQGKLWQELDLQVLVQMPDFINISAS